MATQCNRSRNNLCARKSSFRRKLQANKESSIPAESPEKPLSFCIHFLARAYIGDTMHLIAKQFMRSCKMLLGNIASKQKRTLSQQNHQKNHSPFIYISQQGRTLATRCSQSRSDLYAGRENAFGEILRANKKSAESQQYHQTTHSLFIYIS